MGEYTFTAKANCTCRILIWEIQALLIQARLICDRNEI
jgi:hypothetical protein